MGRLYYANSTEAIAIPDRELAHLRVVVTTKLRRSESFSISWTDPASPEGRSTLWMHCSIPLRFELDHAVDALDRRYLESLADAANSAAGVVLDMTDSSDGAASMPAPSELRRVA